MAGVSCAESDEDAKASLRSLLSQTGQVFVGFIVMLLLTGGNPSSFIVVLSVVLGMGFVAWSETKRLTDVEGGEIEVTSTTPEQTKLNVRRPVEGVSSSIFFPNDISLNKRAVLIIVSRLKSVSELQELIQRVVKADTDSFLKLVEIAGLNPFKDLVEANLSSADLRYARLSDTNLRGADLSGADLRYAELWHNNLSGADLSGANVEKTLFRYNEGIPEAMRRNLEARGAIFEDSRGDRSATSTPR